MRDHPPPGLSRPWYSPPARLVARTTSSRGSNPAAPRMTPATRIAAPSSAHRTTRSRAFQATGEHLAEAETGETPAGGAPGPGPPADGQLDADQRRGQPRRELDADTATV